MFFEALAAVSAHNLCTIAVDLLFLNYPLIHLVMWNLSRPPTLSAYTRNPLTSFHFRHLGRPLTDSNRRNSFCSKSFKLNTSPNKSPWFAVIEWLPPLIRQRAFSHRFGLSQSFVARLTSRDLFTQQLLNFLLAQNKQLDSYRLKWQSRARTRLKSLNSVGFGCIIFGLFI